MTASSWTWMILTELEAQRRAEPERVAVTGQIDLDPFLRRSQLTMSEYSEAAHELRARGLVAEPSIDQLMVSNGGLYITDSGSQYLRQLRAQLFGRLQASLPTIEPVATDLIRRAWRSFSSTGMWPSFKTIEKGLTIASPPGTDMYQVAQSLPHWAANVQIGSDSPIYVRLLGVVAVLGDEAAPLLEDFWRALSLARDRFLSSGEDVEAELTDRDLSEVLHLDQPRRTQIRDLLQTEGFVWSGSASADGQWEFVIANRIHDFRDTIDLEAYIETRINQEVQRTTSMAESPAELAVGPKADPRKVFVIHGRDTQARDAVFGFLRSVDLHPLEWEELVAQTGQGTPFTGDVVARAFGEAQAVVAIFTPDDEVRLHPSLWDADEDEAEKQYQGQPRPNVYFEAGMAFNGAPERTILLEIGRIKHASDLHGRNVLRLHAGASSLLAFYQRLENAGCAVNKANPKWLDASRFAGLHARTRHKGISGGTNPAPLPEGYVLERVPKPATPGLRAKLHKRGTGDYLLDLTNTGGLTLHDVEWRLEPEAANWGILSDALPRYPYPQLPPRESLRVPVVVTMGGPPMVELIMKAKLDDGTPHEFKSLLSVYG